MKCIILSILACVTFSRVAFASTLVRDGTNGTNCVGAADMVQKLNNILKVPNGELLEQARVVIKLISYQASRNATNLLPELTGVLKIAFTAFSEQVNSSLNLLGSTGSPRNVTERVRKLRMVNSGLSELADALIKLVDSSQDMAGVVILVPELTPIITIAANTLGQQANSSAKLLIPHASANVAGVVPEMTRMLQQATEALSKQAKSVGDLMTLQISTGAGPILYELNKILAIANTALFQQAITSMNSQKSREFLQNSVKQVVSQAHNVLEVPAYP